MKNKYTLLFLFLLLITACVNLDDRKKLSSVEDLKNNYPDSAVHMLEADFNPRLMSDENLAKWCMLNGDIRDSLKLEMDIDTTLLHRAFSYYGKRNNLASKAKIGLYYGRSLVLENDFDRAIPVYLFALEQAGLAKDFNLAGYISSYTADVYYSEYESELARNYYLKAEEYFSLANNIRSQAIAFRDIGYTYSLDALNEEALSWLLKSDSVSRILEDSILMASIMNASGIIYYELGQYNLAEDCILKSVPLMKDNELSNYNVLVDIFIKQKEYSKANRYLDSLSLYLDDAEWKVSFYRQHYMLEKERGNADMALKYYELCMQCTDSIWEENHSKELYEIAQKYEQEHLINANNELKIQKQRILIIVIFLGILIAALSIGARALIRRKKKELAVKEQEAEKQRLLAENQEIALRAKENELFQIKKRFSMIKDFLFQRSLLYEKVKLISELPVKGDRRKKEYDRAIQEMFKEPFLSNNDWAMLREITNELYSSFTNKLLEAVPILSDEEINFCCLLRFGLPSDKVLVLLDIAPATLKSKRHRIMTKAGLVNQNIKLEDFLDSL